MAENPAQHPETTPPSPADRPEAAVVVYDGACNFCRAQMWRLMWWDCLGKLAYLSMHDPEVRQRWPDLPHDRLKQEMCLIDQAGGRHWGADAFRVLTLKLRRLWWLAPMMNLPGAMFLARPIYRWVSKNRYLIAGRADCESGSCEI